MAGDDAVLVEDFLEAIATQLDRAQDGLAFKAVNRPLTYAIKDFSLQLQAFVEVDEDGNVRIRSSGPNEVGASMMTIGFTTITRPMIQENTIALSASKGPTLDDAGFSPAERRRLERLGVRNTNQLRRLGSSTGASVVSRLSQVPVDRLRAALQLDRPAVKSVQSITPGHTNGGATSGGGNGTSHPAPPAGPSLVEKVRQGPMRIRVAPGASHLEVIGSSLAGDDLAPNVRLDGEPVAIAEHDWDRIVVPVPLAMTSGLLEVELPDGEVTAYELVRDGDAAETPAADDWEAEVP